MLLDSQKPRKPYGQWLTWGHAIRKQMDRVRLDRKQWSIRARDRACWSSGTLFAKFKPRESLEGRNVEIFYESGEVRVHQPYIRRRKRHTLYVVTDEWFSGDVTRETTKANGDIEMRLRRGAAWSSQSLSPAPFGKACEDHKILLTFFIK